MAHVHFILMISVTLCTADATTIASDDTGNVPARHRRSAKQFGTHVFEYILSKAKFLFKNDFGEEVYLRKGGMNQARTDFYATNPEHVRDMLIGNGKEGSVGDKAILLYKPDGLMSTPSLSIQSKRGNFPDVRIIYKD